MLPTFINSVIDRTTLHSSSRALLESELTSTKRFPARVLLVCVPNIDQAKAQPYATWDSKDITLNTRLASISCKALHAHRSRSRELQTQECTKNSRSNFSHQEGSTPTQGSLEPRVSANECNQERRVRSPLCGYCATLQAGTVPPYRVCSTPEVDKNICSTPRAAALGQR